MRTAGVVLAVAAFTLLDADVAAARDVPADQAGEVRIEVGDRMELRFALAGAPASGWRVSGPVIGWPGDAPPQALMMRLEPAPGGAPSLADFDELWIDHATEPEVLACRIDVRLRAAARDLARPHEPAWPVEARTDQAALDVALASKPPPRSWRPKDAWYLAARLLALAPDEVWRYDAGAAEGLVVQRRWRLDLAGIEAIDIAFSSAVAPSQVNVVVRTGSALGESAVLPFDGIPADSRLEDGRPGVRLPLAPAIAQRFPMQWSRHLKGRGSSFRLEEVILFFRGADRAAAGNPVAEVSFLGRTRQGAAASEQPPPVVHRLATDVREIANGRLRVATGLASLTAGHDAVLEQALLAITPPPAQRACALRLESMQLVSTYRRRAWSTQ